MWPSAWANKVKALKLRLRARWVRVRSHEYAANLRQAAAMMVLMMMMVVVMVVVMVAVNVLHRSRRGRRLVQLALDHHIDLGGLNTAAVYPGQAQIRTQAK